MANYSFKELPAAANGATIEGHNMVRAVPHTKIYEGVTGLTFRNCNLTNCDVPADAVVFQCNTGNVTFCSNIHPYWLDMGFIAECSVECEHVTQIDTVTIDGVVVDTNYIRHDKVME